MNNAAIVGTVRTCGYCDGTGRVFYTDKTVKGCECCKGTGEVRQYPKVQSK
jgi:DnaJ-class molecular chaperone